MPTSHRFRRAVLSASLALVGVLALGWLLLYLDSLHERRRAEHLIADLKSFAFANAGFFEVREIANRYGGSAIQPLPLQQLRPPGPPLRKSPSVADSEERAPQARTGRDCTPQHCIFEVHIRPHPFDQSLDDQKLWFLYTALGSVGLRPWVVYARFEVRDGTLWESLAGVGQFKPARIGAYKGLVPQGYQVVYMSRANALDSHRPEYAVGVPHITGTVSDELWTWIAQAPNAPINRAFDVRLHCLTTVSHACRGFAEIAPSAWSDYQAEKESRLKQKP
jgi:hypothetical protein